MRLVLDTNVLVAALTTRGFCTEILEYCVHQHEVVSSSHLLNELDRVLSSKFHYSHSETQVAMTLIKNKIDLVRPSPFLRQVCRDKDDDLVLATALAGDCECIVTGDPDLLVLRKFKGIQILSPRDFWKFEGR